MRASSLNYTYLRRWCPWLLVGIGLGALAGIGSHTQLDRQIEYTATMTVVIADEQSFTVVSGKFEDPKTALQSILTMADRLGERTIGEIELRDYAIQQRNLSSAWKKAALGSLLGGLLIVTLVYVVEEVRSFAHHRQEMGPPDT